MLIDLPTTNDSYETVWDKPVPIIRVNSYRYRVYILDNIEEPSVYAELVELLNDLDSDVRIEFYINTPGGVLDSATMLMNAIKECKAYTVAKLSGTVASAGTMLALVMDELEIAPFTSFMIHNYSHGTNGSGSQVKGQVDFLNKELLKLYREVYKNFLTPQEITKVVKDDKEIWLNAEEVKKRVQSMKYRKQ